MIRFLRRLFRTPTRLARRAPRRPGRPGVEHLETRLMPAVTDLTALAAQLVPTPDHPTHLYLNFDGYQDSSHTVAAYNSSAQTVNDVLYRVSEIFSPFNVQVSQLYGAGSFDDGNGSSTIFIGDDTANSFPLAGGKVLNTASGYTTPQYSDFPGDTLGDQHVPHSNPFNLAYIDPIGATTVWGPTQISQAIAHEAGHTFGLAHVLSGGTAEAMNYSGNPTQYFADATFNLTDLNYNPATGTNDHVSSVVPKYDGTTLTTQNSFTYLEQVLGDRPDDGLSHVVHGASVDPNHYTAPRVTTLTLSSDKTGTIGSPGDYVVYWVKARVDTANVEVNLTPTGAGGLIPNLLVYQNGNLVQYNDSYRNADSQQQEVHTTVSLAAGQTYAFVVGGAGANSTGGYRLQTKVPLDQITGAVNINVVGTWTGDSRSDLVVVPINPWKQVSPFGGASVQDVSRLVPVGNFLLSSTPGPDTADTPLALTAAEVLTLGSDPSFVVSAQGADIRAALAQQVVPDGGLNGAVLTFAQDHLGTTVGDGQCWALVDQALQAAGADTSGDVNYVFGSPIGLDALTPGDVLQFEGVHFAGIDPVTGDSYTQYFSHHTAIVEAVDGDQVTLLNQNVNGDMTVQETIIHLADQQDGTLSAYRPQAVAQDPAAPSAQTITFDAVADHTYGDAAFTLDATASSGLPVSYQVLSGPATIQDGVLTITGAGTVTVEASQAGDGANFDAATPVDQTFTVNKAHLSVSVDSLSRPYGQDNPGSITATITGFVNGETLETSGVSGPVAFNCTATVNSPVGMYAITGDLTGLQADNYDFSAVDGQLTISKAATTVALQASISSAAAGQPVTLTATVAGLGQGAGMPSGTVTFKDGATVLGTASLNNGVAVFQSATLSAGTHNITAVYGGDGNFTGSTSAALTETVQRAVQHAAAHVTLSSSAHSARLGQAITLTARVSGSTAGLPAPSGTVTFKDGSTVLGKGTVKNGMVIFQTAKLKKGKHTLTAVYSGDANFMASTSIAWAETIS